MGRFFQMISGFIGGLLGLALALLLRGLGLFKTLTSPWPIIILVALILFGFILFYALSPFFSRTLRKTQDSMMERFEKVPLSDVVIATGGLLVGLLIGTILSSPILSLSMDFLGNTIGVILSVIIHLFLGVLGVRIALSHKEDIMGLLPAKTPKVAGEGRIKPKKSKRNQVFVAEEEEEEEEEDLGPSSQPIPKILDTSVIIDGRIFEVMKAGFLEGPIIVSHYVLEELQHISDSSDALRRNRGRGGLDLLHEMQRMSDLEIIIDNTEIRRAKEVDAKLLILTRKYKGFIVTNDYNLNKVASVQNIRVLNVNDLANALKPIVIPGEEMEVSIIKSGKEPGQGLGYLDDGTMIVVEDGYEAIGRKVETTVTSVLQTSAGKMIFTRIHPQDKG